MCYEVCSVNSELLTKGQLLCVSYSVKVDRRNSIRPLYIPFECQLFLFLLIAVFELKTRASSQVPFYAIVPTKEVKRKRLRFAEDKSNRTSLLSLKVLALFFSQRLI